ncbi:mitochondrial carrier [Meredithblackwellia eburnea MCA 4105]
MTDQIRLSTAEGFASGALAACTAVTITNPLEVAKTRLQLDGELQARKPSATAALPTAGAPGTAIPKAGLAPQAGPSGRVYTSAWDCMKKTWKFEGIRGVQRGLGAAYTYQVALNGSRLGFFEPIRRSLNQLAGNDANEVKAWSSITAGASSGVIGAIFGNPLFLVKARMQAYSKFNPVGAQHQYKSVIHAFSVIIKADGIKGLARGVDAAMLRTAMGSSVQLPAYNLAKVQLEKLGMKDGIIKYLMSSTFSGLCVCAVMQPADTALTRMYNQAPNSIGPDGKPRGLLYKNPIDCLYKTWKVEGVRGWYKGTTAHLARIAPHTVVTLVTNEFITRHWIELKASRAAKLD